MLEPPAPGKPRPVAILTSGPHQKWRLGTRLCVIGGQRYAIDICAEVRPLAPQPAPILAFPSDAPAVPPSAVNVPASGRCWSEEWSRRRMDEVPDGNAAHSFGYAISADNQVAKFVSEQAVPTRAGEQFRSEQELAALVRRWPTQRLLEVWNQLPGQAAVRRFRDRQTAVRRIWQALQNLEATGGPTQP